MYIKKTEILPQPEDDPPLAMAAAVKMIEIYIVLEQVSCGRVHLGMIFTSRSRYSLQLMLRQKHLQQHSPWTIIL